MDQEQPVHKRAKMEKLCEACLSKGRNVLATIYCKTCYKLLCNDHQKSHDELHENHSTCTLMPTQYGEQTDRVGPRFCPEHPRFEYAWGCSTCLKVYCEICRILSRKCTNGNAHELRPLEQVATEVGSRTASLVQTMLSKEKRLQSLRQNCVKKRAEFQSETKGIIELLETRRDAQVRAIEEHYKRFKRGLLNEREKTEQEINSFVKENIDDVTLKLQSQRMYMETTLQRMHDVDKVEKYRDRQEAIGKLAKSPIPSLEVYGAQRLGILGRKRDIEVEVVPEGSIVIKPQSILPAAPLLKPSTMLHFVETPTFCHAVCHYGKKTYLCTQSNTIDAIDFSGERKTIVKFGAHRWASDIGIHNNEIYTLVSNLKGLPRNVNVYDLTGQMLSQWNRDDTSNYARLAIVADKLVVADNQGKKLTVYSFVGEIKAHVPFYILQDNSFSLCAVDNDSVIVTSYKSSIIQRISVTGGTTTWQSTEINQPEASALYKNNLLCIAKHKELSFLDVKTGNLVFRATAAIASDHPHYIDVDVDHKNDLLIASSREWQVSKLVYCKLSSIVPTAYQ